MNRMVGSAVRPFVRIVTVLIMSSTVIWAIALVCDRLSSLHTLYHVELAHLRDQEWLRQKCKDPEFYANMTRFSTVCADVERNALQNVFWRCVSIVLQQTYLCGQFSCMQYAEEGVLWLARLSMPVLIMLMVVAFVCPMMIIQFVRVCYDAFRPIAYSHNDYHYDTNLMYTNAAQYKMLRIDEVPYSAAESALPRNMLSSSGHYRPGAVNHQYAALQDFE